MIDRKEFLMMCQKNSVYPQSCKIKYHDAEYYPLALYIWFDDKGNPHKEVEKYEN